MGDFDTEIKRTHIHPKLDLVNVVVRPLLFTKSSLNKELNMKKGAGIYSLTADA